VRHYAQVTEVFFAGWRPGSPVAEKNYNPEYGAQDFLGSMTVLGCSRISFCRFGGR